VNFNVGLAEKPTSMHPAASDILGSELPCGDAAARLRKNRTPATIPNDGWQPILLKNSC
jgi:hypothetical protein